MTIPRFLGQAKQVVGVLVALALPMSASAQGASAPPIDYERAHETRRILATRTTLTVRLDGRLDEAAWGSARVARDFIQNDPREGEPATYDTEVRLLYDDQALYLGVFAKDDETGSLIVNELRKDFNTSSGDTIQVVIDTFRDGRNGSSSPPIPRAPSGTRRCRTKAATSTAIGTASGTWPPASRTTAGTRRFGFRFGR